MKTNNFKTLMTSVRKWHQETPDYWMEGGHDEASACALANIAIRFRENTRGEITQAPRTTLVDFSYGG